MAVDWESLYRGEQRAHGATVFLLNAAERKNAPLKWRVADLEARLKRLELKNAELETEAQTWRLRFENRGAYAK